MGKTDAGFLTQAPKLQPLSGNEPDSPIGSLLLSPSAAGGRRPPGGACPESRERENQTPAASTCPGI